MKTCIDAMVFLMFLTSVSSGAVIVDMLVDDIPVDMVMIPQGMTFTIDFTIVYDDLWPEFVGVVALEGVGILNRPVYPEYIPLPYDPPTLPANEWPIYYVPPLVIPPVPAPGVFASSLYEATTIGTATVNLYQSDPAFISFERIDSFDIHVIPEPCTMLLCGVGALLLNRQRARSCRS